MAAAGIAEHRHIAGLCHLVDLVQDGIIRLAAGRSAGHAQAVCKATEHDRLCHHLNIPLHQIAVCLGVHLEQQLHIRDLQRLAVADCLAGDIDYAGEKTMCALQVAVELLNQTEGYSNYDKFQQGAGMITTVIRKARAHVAQRALDFAEEYKNDSVIYTMGSGAGYGAAYMESICIFMEMQWIHSGTIHTGEFFHGPFEVTDANTPFVIQVSEGSTRELDERCLKFLHTYAKRIEVLDAKELGLSVIDPAVVDYFNHSLFNNVYPIYNHALAETRQHPLTTRRYMWKVAY